MNFCSRTGRSNVYFQELIEFIFYVHSEQKQNALKYSYIHFSIYNLFASLHESSNIYFALFPLLYVLIIDS